MDYMQADQRLTDLAWAFVQTLLVRFFSSLDPYTR